jgi:hydroxyacylglutathione hydrolase
MIFKRFYDEALAQASYLIGCGRSGQAVVIDANRLVDQYLEAAAAEGLEITAVTETHIHADFLSGSRELAARTGATLYLSAMGPAEWRYAFRAEPNITLLRDRDRITIGNVVIEAVHTPGHTPEHLCFLVTDGAVANEPMGVVTGDFVFVGDVGRPDLLEKAVQVVGASERSARELYRSLAWFKTLPDHLQIWPGHGAGSACGKGLSAVPQSTVGYERRYNWAFEPATEAAFVHQVLIGQPEPPRYFAVMKRLNRDGPALLGALPEPERIGERRLAEVLQSGAVVIDTRSAPEFAAGHIPGTVSLPAGRSFTTYAGSILPYDRDLYLITPSVPPEALAGVVRALVTIGLDRIRGYAGPEAVALWSAGGSDLETTPEITVNDLESVPQQLVLDVRNRSEWDSGHIPGARHLPLANLLDQLDSIPSDANLLVHCQGGGRSAIATGLLLAHGRKRVTNLAGGLSAWVAAGRPVEL